MFLHKIVGIWAVSGGERAEMIGYLYGRENRQARFRDVSEGTRRHLSYSQLCEVELVSPN